MRPAPAGTASPLRAAVAAWLTARLVVGAALVTAAVVRDEWRLVTEPIGTRLQGGLLSWDGTWYLRIAEGGYDPLPEEGLRFFPAYPLLGRLLGVVLGGADVALVVLANAAALGFAVALVLLVRAEIGDGAAAARSAWLAAVAPPAFVLAMAYTEPLAGLLAVGAFAALRRGRWGAAAAVLALSGALRPSGILLCVPAAVEAARGLRSAPRRQWPARAVAVAAPVLGTAPYLLWVHATRGDWWLPYRVQQVPGLRGSFANPIGTLTDALSGLDGSDVVLGLRALWASGAVALVVVALRRLPASYGLYAAVTLVSAVSTTSIGSLERYVYGAFPVLVAAALLLARPAVERAVLVTSGAWMGLYAVLAFLDTYVP